MSEENLTPDQILDKAVRQGYDPDRYEKTDPKWKSPEDFLDFGEQLTPVLKERTKYLETKNAELEARIKEIQTKVAEFATVHEQTKKAAYDQAIADLRVERKEALADSDFDKAEELTQKIEETRQASTKQVVKEVQQTEAIPEDVVKSYNAWLSGNTWADDSKPEFNEDMAAYAIAVGQVRINKGQPHTGADFKTHLEYVAKKVQERFPEKFETSKRSNAGMVDGGSDESSSVPLGKRTYNNLPKESKEACDLLVETGTFKSREEYLKKYNWK